MFSLPGLDLLCEVLLQNDGSLVIGFGDNGFRLGGPLLESKGHRGLRYPKIGRNRLKLPDAGACHYPYQAEVYFR